jgi:hypothetical protein
MLQIRTVDIPYRYVYNIFSILRSEGTIYVNFFQYIKLHTVVPVHTVRNCSGDSMYRYLLYRDISFVWKGPGTGTANRFRCNDLIAFALFLYDLLLQRACLDLSQITWTPT